VFFDGECRRLIGGKPLPAWLTARRGSMERASAIDRPIFPDVDIRLPKPLDALWFSTVSAKRSSRRMRVPARISARQTHSRPCVFER
jgi:hypothetical protein